MSYKVKGPSLAEQVNNLADVFSQVKPVPLAKAKIRQQARKGLPEVEGTQASSVMRVVDAYVGVFGAKTPTKDPRDGYKRVGWWNAPLNLFTDKTPKHAYKIGWSRRKLRLEMSDEATRAIRGRPSTETPAPFTLSVSQSSSSLVISGTIGVSVVYANGTIPHFTAGSIYQTAAQEDLFGVTLGGSDSGPGGDREFTFTIPALSMDGEDFILGEDYSSGSALQLIFELQFAAVEPCLNSLGAEVDRVPGSVSEGRVKIVVTLGRGVTAPVSPISGVPITATTMVPL